MSRARARSGARPRSGASDAPRERRGTAPTGLVVAAAALGLALGIGALVRDARAAGFTDIDTRRVALEAEERVPAAWSAWLAERLIELGRLDVEDEAGLAALREEIAAAPFVARVGDGRPVWPDGYELEVELRRPVACVRTGGGDFLAVDAEGVVLPGRRSAPPDRGRGPLPVVGPNDGALDRLVPGDRLPEERHYDALSVALSLAEHLAPTERRLLGPALVDASLADRASVDEPGVRIDLEGRRRLLFGRPPRAGAPGELPEAEKWAHVSRLLRTLEGEPELDWELLDLRWDRAVLVERAGASGAASPEDELADAAEPGRGAALSAAARPSARAALVGAAWALSVLPFAAPAGLEGSLAGLSRTSLCLLPWLALLGLPRGAAARGDGGGALGAALFELALLLPALALAARADRGLGLPAAGTATTAAAGLGAVAALSSSARRAAGAAAHALAWLVLVAGGPALEAALGWAAGGPAPQPVRLLASASPLRWAWSRLDPSGVGGVGARDLLPLGTLALLALLAATVRADPEVEA